MQTLQSTSHDELRKIFWSSFREILELLISKQDIYIGLSGGSSLDIFYSYIREHFHEIPEDIRKKIRFAFLDERVVPVTHPDSNEGQLRGKFLTKILDEGTLGEEQIISIFSSFGGTKNPGNRNSGSFLSSIGPVPSLTDEYNFRVPRIDIALFGVGPDGHIASLFPHHRLLNSREKNYLEITDSPKPPAHRITVSPRMIRDIPYVFVAIMRGKEEVLHCFQNPEIPLEDCPVKMLLDSENLVVMSDIDE